MGRIAGGASFSQTYMIVYMCSFPPSLRVLCAPQKGMALAPGFAVPAVESLDFDGVAEYIMTSLPKEGPPMFGL